MVPIPVVHLLSIMDTSLVLKKEPIFIKVEPMWSEHSSAVSGIIPDADNIKMEDTANFSFESSLPVIKEEMGNSHSVTEIAPDIKTYEEDGNEGVQEETQKLENGHGPFLSNYAKSSVSIEEHAIVPQQSEECRMNSSCIYNLPNRSQVSSSFCKELNGDSGSLEESTPLHIKNRYSCDLCGKTFATKKNLRIHSKVHTGERPYPCIDCGFSFKEKYTLQRHMKVHNKCSAMPKSYSCRHCSRLFSSNSGLKLHKLFCENVAKPCCSALGITWKDLQSRSLKTSMPVSCSVCGKYFQKESYLKQHMAYHSDERPYTCNECGQGFKCRKDILNHLNIHSHFKKYNCDVCGKEFGGSGALIQHKRSHSDRRNYNCNECGKAFKSRNDIVNHVVIHSNSRPLICDVCGFAAKRKLELSLHKTSHSNERPYSCPTCGKTFKHQLYLKKHNKGHITPQSCSICGKNLETPHYLTVHMRLHGTEKPYSCDICKRSFIRRSYLREHIKDIHV